jgi:hypothetical protein
MTEMYNNDYWIQGVKLPQRRGELILTLLDVMDGKYQEAKWIYYSAEGKTIGPISFNHEIASEAELLEDLGLFGALDDGIVPYDNIGWTYKTEKEVDIVLAVAKMIRSYWHNYYTNEEYLSAPELHELRALSLEAFLVFMENEKDNKKFCNFILCAVKEEERWPEMITEGRDPYELILEYVESCRKNNQRIKEAAQIKKP